MMNIRLEDFKAYCLKKWKACRGTARGIVNQPEFQVSDMARRE